MQGVAGTENYERALLFVPTRTSELGDGLVRNCVTLPMGFEAGTVGELVPRYSVLLYSFKDCSEALRKLALPLLPAEAELPCQGCPAEIFTACRTGNGALCKSRGA